MWYEAELTNLKLIVEQYLAFAEAQALNHRPMYMKDWIEKLKLILTMNQFNILEHRGKISKALADTMTREEYQTYKEIEATRKRIESIEDLDRDIMELQASAKKKNSPE